MLVDVGWMCSGGQAVTRDPGGPDSSLAGDNSAGISLSISAWFMGVGAVGVG